MAKAPENMQVDSNSADESAELPAIEMTEEEIIAARPQRVVVLRDFCTRTQGTDCERCIHACPHHVITFAEDGHPTIETSACTYCGICLGICDAFSSTRVTMLDLHARMRRIALRGEDVVLTCKENLFPGFEPAANVVVLPCLASLSPEFWTLILSENLPIKIAADFSYCTECTLAGEIGEMLYAHAITTGEAWSGKHIGYLDVIPEKEGLVKDLADPSGVDRRSAFTNLVGDVGDIASGKRRLRNSEVLQQFHERRERSRALTRLNLGSSTEFNNFVPDGRTKRTMWPKRQMLLEAIDRDPEIAARVPLVISATNCELCTNTLACSAACPTGARNPHPETGLLTFDARYCSGCGLCVESCKQEAIELIETTADALLV